MRQRERFYLVVGAAGLALLAMSWGVRQATLSTAGRLAHVLGSVVVAVWVVAGIVEFRRAAREAQERVEAAEQAKAVRREAQEAARRAARQVNARRTTSHAGQTISVRRASLQGNARAGEQGNDGDVST